MEDHGPVPHGSPDVPEHLDSAIGSAFDHDQVRISLLWKAYAFADQAALDEYNNHANDLDHRMVVDMFAADLRERGLAFKRPTDPVADPEWKALLAEVYTAKFKGNDASAVDY